MPQGKLVICPTPLGNLGDMTQRAIDALRHADCICCEDTRVTGKLLAALGVEGVRLERLDEEVLSTRTPEILARVQDGQTIAYCSDAGMPGVSDPGQRLVAAARAADVPVEVLPGPVAAITAYVASGFTCPQFYFGGFFPRKDQQRTQVLDTIQTLDAVSLFYESPHRIADALDAVAHVLPNRQVAVCRELTKLHEEIRIGSAEELAAEFKQRHKKQGIKGEVVLVIDTAGKEEQTARENDAREQAKQAAERMRAEGVLSKKDMVAQLQESFGIARNDAYELVHSA